MASKFIPTVALLRAPDDATAVLAFFFRFSQCVFFKQEVSSVLLDAARALPGVAVSCLWCLAASAKV